MPRPASPSRRAALDEVALEGEEDRERDQERDERRRRDQLDVGAEGAELREDRDGDRLCLRPKVSATRRSFHVQRNWKIARRRNRRQSERKDEAQEDADL